ncbi:MAG: hypothetical protein J6M53_09900 [Bacteroidaceae bacterium]|nr:hypothetical protein [Bacteroidaceae bacterium]
MIRKATTVRLPDYLLADMSAAARRKGVSVSRFIEEIAAAAIYKPNAETMEALRECRSDAELEDFNPADLDQYIYATPQTVHAI